MSVGHFPFFGLTKFGGYWDPNTNTLTGTLGNTGIVSETPVSNALANGNLNSVVVTPAGAQLSPFNGLYFSVNTATTGSSGTTIDSMGSLNINDLVIYDANNSSDIKWLRVDFGTVFSSVFFGDLSQNGIGNSNPISFTSDFATPRASYFRILSKKGDDGILFSKIEDAGSLRISTDTEAKLDEF
tara:strand:- start:5386 stop:5940 length:555 start_codon:yes stop_codon:yes gene_type:complete